MSDTQNPARASWDREVLWQRGKRDVRDTDWDRWDNTFSNISLFANNWLIGTVETVGTECVQLVGNKMKSWGMVVRS